MVSTDPLADMFSRIRNAIGAGQTEVELPSSEVKEGVAKILVQAGFLAGSSVNQESGRKQLLIIINHQDTNPAITTLKRLSRPGRRQYVKSKEIPVVKRGRGLVVVSTSQGLMTGQQAKAQKLGGELICEVY